MLPRDVAHRDATTEGSTIMTTNPIHASTTSLTARRAVAAIAVIASSSVGFVALATATTGAEPSVAVKQFASKGFVLDTSKHMLKVRDPDHAAQIKG
jgi:hypothetical protein